MDCLRAIAPNAGRMRFPSRQPYDWIVLGFRPFMARVLSQVCVVLKRERLRLEATRSHRVRPCSDVSVNRHLVVVSQQALA